MEISKKDVGSRIALVRRKMGLTMEAFGELINNASKSNVSKWENGISLPTNQRLKKIAEIGNVTVSYLLYGEEDSKKRVREKIPMFISIQWLRKRLNMTKKKFGELCSPPVTAKKVSEWEEGVSEPAKGQLNELYFLLEKEIFDSYPNITGNHSLIDYVREELLDLYISLRDNVFFKHFTFYLSKEVYPDIPTYLEGFEVYAYEDNTSIKIELIEDILSLLGSCLSEIDKLTEKYPDLPPKIETLFHISSNKTKKDIDFNKLSSDQKQIIENIAKEYLNRL